MVAASALSALVTFAGSVGLTFQTSLANAIQILHAPANVQSTTSTAFMTVPLCRAGATGTALFVGPDNALEPSVRTPEGRLIAIFFNSGAHTDHGVGIGSTKTDVRHAYTHIYKTSESPSRADLFAIGPPTLVNNNPNVHPVMLFKFTRGRVTELVLTIRGELKNSPFVTDADQMKTYCP